MRRTRLDASPLTGLGFDPVAVGVVVVNYGSSSLLIDNLAPLTPTASGVHIIVVDNYSSPAERTAVSELCARRGWHVVQSPDNLGFGAGTNLGVTRAKALGCRTFVLLNPDARITADTLEALRQHTLAEPMTLVAPRIAHPDGRPAFDGSSILMERGRTGHPRPNEPGEVLPWLSGACLAISRQLWDRLGGFDDDYFLYWEDVDLSYRCLKAGGRVHVRRDLTVLHSVGGTQGGLRTKSSTYYYNNCRNRLLFAAKHLPARLLVRWLVQTPAYARAVVLRGGRKQLIRPWSPLSSAVRGSASGVGLACVALLRKAVSRRRAPIPWGPRMNMHDDDASGAA